MGTSSVLKSESVVTKRRLGIAGAAAFIACAACCAIPMLAAAGFGGGVIAAASWAFRPGSELVVGVTVFLGAIVVMVVRSQLKRRSVQACGPACQVDGGCCDHGTVARNA